MNELQRYLAEEFVEDYQEGRLSRREALKLIASVTGSLVLANGLLAACAPLAATSPPATAALPSDSPPPPSPTREAATAAPTETASPATAERAAPTAAATGTTSAADRAILAEAVQFPSGDATITGYLARPAGDGPFAVVLVCHENRGLTDHIRDVTRRLAQAGYAALAVDLLSRQGGTEAVGSGNVPGALGNIPEDQFVEDFVAGWRYLGEQTYAQAERVGMVGFCFGGGITWRVATRMPELKAAVPFYGPHPALEAVPNINAAVLAIYAERDQRINQGIAAIEAAMQQHAKVYAKVIYPNADHAFHNDTGARYNPEAAQDAWARTLAWFEQYLAP